MCKVNACMVMSNMVRAQKVELSKLPRILQKDLKLPENFMCFRSSFFRVRL